MHPDMQAKPFSRGAELSYKTLANVPADDTVRPIHDQIVVEPLDGAISSIILVIEERKPVSGIIRAVGPGCWLKQYATGSPPTWYPTYAPPPKGQRTRMRDSKIFRPTEVKVGDRIELDVVRAQALQTFFWGERLMLMAREEDVAAVHEDTHAAA